ncbi:hypothetical protein DFA_03518 [Cavenderia fasciculata]|uniref:Uncharacterized protein n=1 Tax=Cavenderia fasciculata TaxID=261658 RepID=F4PHT6_CACFS|nr:uncharacterized protein DFA_03518 [Cavenderia fasciculata]EGG25270.1 hypothetical protein DFA_03518 [Cavenderia fasciculata]|eukprot:XP_004363121.1 hypothetical protein DFA_03518 [Cavenderia fasciculata]
METLTIEPQSTVIKDTTNNNNNTTTDSNNNQDDQLDNNNNDSSSSSATASSSFDVLHIIYSLSNWLRGIENKEEFDEEEYRVREKELWKDWEWVLSTTEEFVLKQNQIESEKVLGEINNLKKTASNLKLKPFFINRASELLKRQPQDDVETLKAPLDSSKRSAVVAAVVNIMEEEWLNYIKEKLFREEFLNDSIIESQAAALEDSSSSSSSSSQSSLDDQTESAEEGWEEKQIEKEDQQEEQEKPSLPSIEQQTNEEEIKDLKLDSTTFDMFVLNKNINKITWNQFIDSFKGQKYSKGINVRMKDIGFQASHGFDGSLNSRVLGDITWSIWNTLATALKQIRELTVEESDGLVEIVCSLQPTLLKLWLNTKLNSRVGAKNEGLVVEKWKNEEVLKKKKILELKKSGKLDKYTGEKTKILAHERREISSLRSTLEKKLKLRTN